MRNWTIDSKNEHRRACALIVASPADELQLKFDEARTFGMTPQAVSDASIVYDTLEDNLIQQIEQ